MSPLPARPKLLGEGDRPANRQGLKQRLSLLFAGLFVGILYLHWQTSAIGDELALLLVIALVAAYGAATNLLAFRAGKRTAEVLSFAPQILREMSVGVVLTDADYRIVFANPAFSRMLGRPIGRVVGSLTQDVVHPQDRAALSREQGRRKGGASTTYRLRLWGDTPAPVEVLITASPFFDRGRFDGTIGLIHDISETVLARREAVQARNVSGFLFDAFAHDLSNSLQSVIGRAHVAVALSKAGSPNSGAAMAAAAASAEHTARLLREVKQIAIAERDDWPQRQTTVGELVEQAISEANLSCDCSVLTDMPRGVGTMRLMASELGSVAISKLMEEAASHNARGAAPAQITLEVRQGELGLSSAIVRVHGCTEERPVADLELAMSSPHDMPSGEMPWRSGLKLVLAASVARPHGWKLRAYPEAHGPGTVFELRVRTIPAAPEPDALTRRPRIRRGSARSP